MADQQNTSVAFNNNPFAPDVFADAATGFFILNGVVRITFEAAHVNHQATPGPIDRVVIGRLAMPTNAAEDLARGILKFLEEQGALRASAE